MIDLLCELFALAVYGHQNAVHRFGSEAQVAIETSSCISPVKPRTRTSFCSHARR